MQGGLHDEGDAVISSLSQPFSSSVTITEAPTAEVDEYKESKEEDVLHNPIIEVENEEVSDGLGRVGLYTGQLDTCTRMPCDPVKGIMIYHQNLQDDNDPKSNPHHGISRYSGSWSRSSQNDKSQRSNAMPSSSGLWDGQGELLFESGHCYRGNFQFGHRHGLGMFTWADGREYVGQFEHDQRHGQGKYTWKNNADVNDDSFVVVYEGNFSHNQREGHGKYIDSVAQIEYVGEWLAGVYEGHGVYNWLDPITGNKQTYRGCFVAGKPHGRGVQIDHNGVVVHDGEWKQGEPIQPIAETGEGRGMSTPDPKSNLTTPTPATPDQLRQHQTPANATKHHISIFQEDNLRRNSNDDVPDETEYTEVVNGKVWTDNLNGDEEDDFAPQAVYRGLWHVTRQVPHGNGTAEYGSENSDNTSRNKKKYTKVNSSDQAAAPVLRYEGCFLKGRYHGHGRLWFSNGDVYEGEFHHSDRHGRGVYRWADGRQYTGDFQNCVRNGKGVFSYVNADLYEGGFLDGKRHGIGTFVFADGSKYEGEWVAGKYHGQGKLITREGKTYEGLFEYGLPHGRGTQMDANGIVMYEGEWMHGLQEEQYREQQKKKEQASKETPVKSHPSAMSQRNSNENSAVPTRRDRNSLGHPAPGDSSPVSDNRAEEASLTPSVLFSQTRVDTGACETVVDELVEDAQGNPGRYTGIVSKVSRQPHGVGRLVYQDGKRIHEGFWMAGHKHGHGRCLFFPQGDYHEGEYNHNLRHGPGQYVWKDGRVYSGEYKNDLRHGKGSFSYPSGERYVGMFEKGQRCGHGRFDFDIDNATKGHYEGNWLAGKYHGEGMLVWTSHAASDSSEDTGNAYYKGEFQDGLFHGQGIRKDPSRGLLQEGLWFQGKFQPEPKVTDDDIFESAPIDTDTADVGEMDSPVRLDIPKDQYEIDLDSSQYEVNLDSSQYEVDLDSGADGGSAEWGAMGGSAGDGISADNQDEKQDSAVDVAAVINEGEADEEIPEKEDSFIIEPPP